MSFYFKRVLNAFQVARLHANEQMSEIKNRTFNHIFNRVEVSRLNVLVSYKASYPTHFLL